MTLLAAFQLLLRRYSGQDDIIVGTPIANRSQSELEQLIGFFVNTLVLRSDLSGAPSFKELLARVRAVCLDAYAHQDLPFEKLVEELKPERDQSRNPLFQVMFVLQNAPRAFAAIPDLRIEPVETESTRSQFDLSLFLREREGRFIGFIEYSTDSIRPRLGSSAWPVIFKHCSKASVADPEQPISTLPILIGIRAASNSWSNGTTQRRIIRKTNASIISLKNKSSVRRMRLQLSSKAQHLTYGELNRRANQLAHHLISLGVGPEKLVGICVERSIGNGGWIAGHIKSRWRLCPARSIVSGRTTTISCWKMPTSRCW